MGKPEQRRTSTSAPSRSSGSIRTWTARYGDSARARHRSDCTQATGAQAIGRLDRALRTPDSSSSATRTVSGAVSLTARSRARASRTSLPRVASTTPVPAPPPIAAPLAAPSPPPRMPPMTAPAAGAAADLGRVLLLRRGRQPRDGRRADRARVRRRPADRSVEAERRSRARPFTLRRPLRARHVAEHDRSRRQRLHAVDRDRPPQRRANGILDPAGVRADRRSSASTGSTVPAGSVTSRYRVALDASRSWRWRRPRRRCGDGAAGPGAVAAPSCRARRRDVRRADLSGAVAVRRRRRACTSTDAVTVTPSRSGRHVAPGRDVRAGSARIRRERRTVPDERTSLLISHPECSCAMGMPGLPLP